MKSFAKNLVCSSASHFFYTVLVVVVVVLPHQQHQQQEGIILLSQKKAVSITLFGYSRDPAFDSRGRSPSVAAWASAWFVDLPQPAFFTPRFTANQVQVPVLGVKEVSESTEFVGIPLFCFVS